MNYSAWDKLGSAVTGLLVVLAVFSLIPSPPRVDHLPCHLVRHSKGALGQGGRNIITKDLREPLCVGYKPGSQPLSSDQKRKMAFTSAQAWGADQIFEEMFVARAAVGCWVFGLILDAAALAVAPTYLVRARGTISSWRSMTSAIVWLRGRCARILAQVSRNASTVSRPVAMTRCSGSPAFAAR